MAEKPLYQSIYEKSARLLQVANVEFFNETLPLFDAGDDVGMVLSPQSFYNVDLNADVFNHCNIQFWEYAQHGYDAISFNSCTGTGLAILANPCVDLDCNMRSTHSFPFSWDRSSTGCWSSKPNGFVN